MRAYDALFDRVLTRVDAERAHRVSFRALRALRLPLSRASLTVESCVPVTVMGLTFPHRLGLAAGFDKNAVGIDALAALGFSHVEVGTVTGLAQPGNPRPRLFRLPADRAIVNRMGFNNDGAEVVAQRLAARSRRHHSTVGGAPLDGRGGTTRRGGEVVVGVNIGKSKVVPEEDQAAVEADYTTSAGLLAPYADYLVVNVSSPNTPGLRTLQAVERLEPLLAAVRRRADQVSGERRVPLLVKIAPDLADEDVFAVADLALAGGLDGIIATNTTISRDRLASDAAAVAAVGAGGLSGQPLTARATEVMRLLRRRVGPGLTLVGVGGIGDADQARARLAAGADLLQAYSGLVYGGPLWPRRVVRGLADEPSTSPGGAR